MLARLRASLFHLLQFRFILHPVRGHAYNLFSLVFYRKVRDCPSSNQKVIGGIRAFVTLIRDGPFPAAQKLDNLIVRHVKTKGLRATTTHPIYE